MTFQSTRPMRGATGSGIYLWEDWDVSIHAPHAGRDSMQGRKEVIGLVFQSTRPMRGATPFPCASPCRRRVSIHAPHAGRDYDWVRYTSCLNSFNPRAPCGARPRKVNVERGGFRFQSTRPMRGATIGGLIMDMTEMFQSTRPMRGATRLALWTVATRDVSIHAPHAGRDFIRHLITPL